MRQKEVGALSCATVVIGVALCVSSFLTAQVYISQAWLLINYGAGYFIGSVTMFAMLRNGHRP